MKAWLMGALALCAAADARTWTSADGKTVEAEMVRVMDGKVYLRPDGTTKLYPFEISDLSSADRAFIEQRNADEAERLRKLERNARDMAWHTDFAKAKAEAAELGYPILFLYTAPSWCGWCRVLDENVLGQSEFEDYARGNLVYYIADFSDRDEGERWKKENAQLHEDFPCSGFPCAYLVSAEGKRLGRIGGAEEEWGPSDYIAKLEKFKKRGAKR